MNLFSVFRELLEGQLSLWQEEAIKKIRINGFYRGRLKTKRLTSKKLLQKNHKRPSPFIPPAEIDLKKIWNDLQQQYFPERSDLSSYRVIWSARRQKRTLASCNIRKLQINVAREMSLSQCRYLLEPLIYHEMCHAVLGDKVGRAGSKRLWHGPQFRALEMRHPGITTLDNWIKSGGWSKAVRSFRSSEYQRARKEELSRISASDSRIKEEAETQPNAAKSNSATGFSLPSNPTPIKSTEPLK